MTFKPDFGTYIKNNWAFNKEIIITSSFIPLNIVFYPDGLSSITANIDDMVVSFDFHDDVLRVFLFIFKKFWLIDPDELKRKLMQQTTQPLVDNFEYSETYIQITGVVLTCNITDTIISPDTSESFTPLLITKAEIIRNPLGFLVPKIFEMQ